MPDGTGRLVTPLMKLQDPRYTKILLVTLPETTPVSEAAALQEDLRRAKIEPYAWVVNSSLALSGTRDPLLTHRIEGEISQIRRVQEGFARRLAVVPWKPSPPVDRAGAGGSDRWRGFGCSLAKPSQQPPAGLASLPLLTVWCEAETEVGQPELGGIGSMYLGSNAVSVPERLNKECFCITLERDLLCAALNREAGDLDFCSQFIKTRPHLFSNAPVFLAQSDIAAMLRVVRAIEAASRLPGYREAVLSWAPAIARHEFGPRGVFMGYDFHLAADGPKLIEVNTNAGGAFLNALLAKAQRACCKEVEEALRISGAQEFDSAVSQMFQSEWGLQRGSGSPRRIAIVDDRPQDQYLYPEFLLAQRFFQQRGIDSVIADPEQLRYERGRLWIGEEAIDLVYNRLVDFSLDDLIHEAVRAAYLNDAVVVTPNPRVHALFADKRNLTLLSDEATLRAWGLPAEMIADLAGVPRTVLVSKANAEQLWQTRKKLFFKPATGHGSKAVYRGDKVTKGVWAEIVAGRYVAQEFAPPSERMIRLDGVSEARKTDVRLYVYDGQILISAARLYQGQATNFRTPGGGFAPVFAV